MRQDYNAGGFLYHAASGKVLLHHRDANAPVFPNLWAGFGGRCEDVDRGDPVATWRREMREELGIELRPEQIVPLHDYVIPGTARRRHVYYALWPTLDADFSLGEGDGFGWFTIREALKLPDLTDRARGDLIALRERLGVIRAAHEHPERRQGQPGLQAELYAIADELRGIANLGRYYGDNVYEVERADQVRKLVARLAALVDEAPPATLTALFDDHWLHVSPVLGVNAFVQNRAGELLMLKRRDNQHWCLPGGVAEIGETPSEAALRELWEEAGLRGEVVRVLGLFDGRLWSTTDKVHMIGLVLLIECADPVAVPGIEMLEARFFPPDALPRPMSSGHASWVPLCIELARSGGSHIDPASSYGVEMPLHQRPESQAERP